MTVLLGMQHGHGHGSRNKQKELLVQKCTAQERRKYQEATSCLKKQKAQYQLYTREVQRPSIKSLSFQRQTSFLLVAAGVLLASASFAFCCALLHDASHGHVTSNKFFMNLQFRPFFYQ